MQQRTLLKESPYAKVGGWEHSASAAIAAVRKRLETSTEKVSQETEKASSLLSRL